MWINKEAHKIIIDNLHYGKEKTRVFVTWRLLSLYLDVHFKNLNSEFFYVLYNEYSRVYRPGPK